MTDNFPRIHVIGSLNIDYTTVTSRFPGPGETITAKSLSISPGGKGANQAVAAGRASHTKEDDHDCRVSLSGAVGADDPHFSALMKPVLDLAGVDCAGVKRVQGAQTGSATVIVDEGVGGENRILVVPGANHEGMLEHNLDLRKELDLSPDCVHVFVLQGEIPAETSFALLRKIRDLRRDDTVEVILNMAPVYEHEIPADCWECVTHLIVNETEMGQLAKGPGEEYTSAETEEGKKAALAIAAKQFHDLQVRNVVITRGADGVFCSSPSGAFHLPAAEVDHVVDTTCAGDTFVGYYAVELARHTKEAGTLADEQVLSRACQRATTAASRCVSKPGAMQSIPWGYEV